jgi:hypothetical protein
MSKTRVLIAMGCCLCALATPSSAQGLKQPGLYEISATMTWQKSPMPAGITLPAGMKSPFGPTTTTTQVCYTQAWIDKYGPTSSSNRDCQVTNVVTRLNSSTADLVCTGKMSGTGTVESSWTDSSHIRSKQHFAGTMAAGANTLPIEWTMDITSNYKGADCGSVKPLPLPAK